MKGRLSFHWLFPLLAGAAFVGVLVAFWLEILRFRGEVEHWARRDLASQSRLAAESLAEPLRTQDFRRIDEIAHGLKDRDGLLLTVYSRPGGGVFYSVPTRGLRKALSERTETDEYTIELGFDDWMVHSPFYGAFMGFLLAALAGVAGMFFVFFALYRQRTRIRELARLERFRREFVADVSHEIKTPLTGIIGAVEMLEDGGAEGPARDRLLAMVSKESRRLNRLVQQILDLARLEKEGDVLELADADLADIARETVESMRPRAEAAGIALSLSVPDAPCVARADARLVGEALGNLVANAIRHSRSPDVSVRVSASPRAFSFVVEDHGVGIPPEHAVRVFERFHRVDPARAAESGGAGLGLAIVRSIARLHGGDVTLEPASPSGCRFTLTIPTRAHARRGKP